MGPRQSPLRAVGSISLATLVSRVLGLVRDQVQSFYFGAGLVTDAFLAAFRIPNLLRDLLAEGALSAAFVPTFTAEMHRRGRDSAWALGSRVITALVLVVGVVTVCIAVFAPAILRIYVFGFEPDKIDLATTMTRILAPFLLFVALAAVAMGMLNACGRYFVPALAPASFNVSMILGMVILWPLLRRAGWNTGLALALGAVVGGLLQLLLQVPSLRREGFRFRPSLALSDPGLRRVGRLMLPATFGLAATQINILVDTILASGLGDGPITWLFLAFRLMQFPIGLFGVAIATANLTFVSRDAARGEMDSLRANLATAFRTAAMLVLPAMAGLIALRAPIVRTLFEHGEFTAEATRHTAAAVLCYAIGLYAYAMVKIQVPTFYALGDTRRPVVASAWAVAVKIAANFVLIAALPRLGFEPFLGLALSTSLAAWVNLALLSRGLRDRVGSLAAHSVARTTGTLALMSAGMGVACALLHGALETVAGGGGLGGDLARLLAAVASGVVLFAAGVRMLGIPEARQLFERFRGSRNG